MKVKIIFVIALILSLICSASAIAASEDITFDQSDINGVSIETNDNLAVSQEDDENLKSVDDSIDFEDEKLSLNDEEVLSENHTVEGDTFNDIQNKINSANEGDTIFLGGKNYTGNQSIFLTKNNLTIIGGSSLDDDAISTLDAKGLVRIMKIEGNNVVIKGIKFINGNSLNGGAILWNAANGSVINCEFHNNTANGDKTNGGAIFSKGNNFSISNSLFNNNSATYVGGAVYSGAPIKIDSCTFTSNNAWAHGAVTLQNTSSVTNSHFINNYAYYQDMGALSVQENAVNSTVENCTFTNNTSNRYVGGMKVFAINVKLKNLTFINNKAKLNSGALSIANTARNCTVDGCIFINNTAGNRGGALNWNGPEGTLLNSHFENNTGVDGGAVYCDGNGARMEGCNFTGNEGSNGGALYFDSDDGVIEGCGFTNNSADYGGAVHTVANNVTVSGSNFTNNSAKFPGSVIWVDGPNNVIKNNTINSNSNTSAIHVTNNHDLIMEGNKPENLNITYTEIVIEVLDKFIGHIGQTLEIPVYIHDNIGDNLVGEVNLTDMEGKHLVNGRVTFYLDITSEHTEPFMLVLTFEHLTRDIWVYPANPEKAIENITQPDDGNDTVEIKFPEDAKGNVTVTVGNKNYTVPVLEGKAVIKINESLNGTYNATVFYSGDEIYKNMTTNLEVVVKNSNISAEIEASDVISDINKEIEIPIIVKNSLGDLMSGNVTISDGTDERSLELVDGKINVIVNPISTPVKFNLTVRYGIYEKTIQVDVVDFKNPIGGISQGEGVDNEVVVRLPGDAKGNVSVVIGSKKYIAPVVNGTAVVKVTDLPNGTYDAEVTYSGDGKYGNMTSDIDVVVKNSDVGVVIEASDVISNVNETVVIPVIVKSSLGDLLTGEVTIVSGTNEVNQSLVDGKININIDPISVPTKFNLTVRYGIYEKTIQVDVVDFKNPIEGISQGEGVDNEVVVRLPKDAEGNVSVVIGSKKYIAPVVNGTAVVKITDLPNGTYDAEVTYSGDGKYGNMTSDIEVVVKNSDVGVVIEASDKIANVNETIEIPVTVKSTLGELLTGEVTLSYDGEIKGIQKLVDGKATFEITPISTPVKLEFTVKYENYTETVKLEVVDPKKPIGDIQQPANGTDSVVINLPSDAKGNVTVTVGDKSYTVPVVNGTAVVKITDLENGNYPAVVTYSGDGKYANMTQNITLSIKNSNVNPVYKLTGKNIKVIFGGKATYTVLVTKDGKAVVGEYVTINFNGKNTNIKTDAKGYATLKLNTKIKVKSYPIKVTYKGISAKNTVKITQVIKASNKKVKKSAKVTKIKVSLKKVNGKYLKKKTLKIKFNKKTYKVKTNKKGVATWKVKKSMLKKLKVGKKVKYTVTYGKATLTKKLTIKK